jgi:hypothetical protein
LIPSQQWWFVSLLSIRSMQQPFQPLWSLFVPDTEPSSYHK